MGTFTMEARQILPFITVFAVVRDEVEIVAEADQFAVEDEPMVIGSRRSLAFVADQRWTRRHDTHHNNSRDHR